MPSDPESLSPVRGRPRRDHTRNSWRRGNELGLTSGDAFLVIDVQRDFLPGGSLAIPDADAIIAPLNEYIAAFDRRDLPIILTRDWHPQNHCSFHSAGGPWPAHCVQGTDGACWPERLAIVPSARIVSKATHPQKDAYSAFAGTSLPALLRTLHIHRLFVAGLATDYCVRETVLDARAHGFDVVLLSDAMRAVNARPTDEAKAMADMQEAGAMLADARRRFTPVNGVA
jgi:nicotinamidase/pyrazinamidase